MKKTLSWLIVLAMVFAMIPAVFAAEETTGSVTLTATELGLANGVPFESKDIDPITFSAAQGENPNNPPKYYSSDSSIRIYELNYLTITPDAGYEITSITVNCVSASYGLDGAACDLTNVASSSNTDTANAVLVPADGTQPVVILNNDNAANNNQLRILSITVDYAVSETPVEPEVPVEPELPENALVIGDNAVELPANETFVEYTYTATEAGTLYIEFTDVGYVSTYSGSYSAQNVDERFNGTNGMAIWFAAYINDVQMPAGYKGSIELAAGETATLKWEYVTYTFAANVKQGTVNVSFEGGNSEGGDVVEPVEGEVFKVETTDTYGYFDTYTFVAPVSGEYTFHIPAGLGLTTPEAYDNHEQPIVDFYDNAEGYTHVIDLYAGQEYEIMVGALEKAEWDIIYTVVEKEVEVPGQGGGEEPQPPVESENVVVLGDTVIDADTLYSYTATEAGTLKIDVSTGSMQYGAFQGTVYNYGTLALEIDGVEVTTAQGIYEMEVTAGQVVTIKVVVKNQMYVGAKINLNLSQAAPVEPTNDVLLGETVIDADVLYTFNATEAGTLKIDVSTGSMQYGAFQGTVYNYGTLALEIDGVEVTTNNGVYEMEVTAGQVVTIKVVVKNQMYAGAKVNLNLTMAAAEGGEEGGEEGGNEGGLILGENNIEGDVEYTYTADAEGTLTINGVGGKVEVGNFGAQNISAYYYQNGSLLLIVNGETIDAANAGVAEIGLKAGDSVTIKIGYGKDTFKNAAAVLTLSFVEGSIGGDEGGDEGNNGTGTQNDPFIIDELPATLTGTLSMDGEFHKYIAEKDGVIVAEYAGFLVTVMVNGENKNLPLTVVAGDEIVFNPWSMSSTASYELKLSYEVEEPDAPVVGSGIGTSSDPFIIEVPYDAEQDASADLYYQFTAPEDGKILVTFEGGACLITGSTVGSWEPMDGGRYIEVAAGDVITINYWNGTGFHVAYEEVSDEFQGTILESVNAVNVSVSAGETVLYKWVATKDGELTVTLDSYSGWYGTYLFNASVNGQDMRFGAIVLNVVAGDEIIFQFSAAGYAGDGSLVFSASYPEEHVCDFVEVERVDESCTVDGYVKYECECGEHYTETLTAPGSHNFVEGSCGICGEADPDYVPECEHNYVDGICGICGEADPNYNPGTGSMNILAIALIAMMSATAVVVTAKKSDEE